MRILLLGCTGFIGKSLIPKLISDGHELCLISRRNINQLKINSSFEKIAFLKLNLAQEKSWDDINFGIKLLPINPVQPNNKIRIFFFFILLNLR